MLFSLNRFHELFGNRLFVVSMILLGFNPVSATEKPSIYSKDNLVAWCIVPYDRQERSPVQRVEMLKNLGLQSLAWDWRQKHLNLLEEEIPLLNKADIELAAVWCWIDGYSTDQLGESNKRVLQALEKTNTKTDIWVSFDAAFFADLTEEEKVAKGSNAISALYERAAKIGCGVSLYNHGDWFGEPANMIKIIQRLEGKDIGVIYNFHHAHLQIEQFENNLKIMLPYLKCVNLNGMRVEGPKILPVGSGNFEKQMMMQLKRSGFQGRVGILGHVEDADVKEVLANNLAGIRSVLLEMEDHDSASTY